MGITGTLPSFSTTNGLMKDGVGGETVYDITTIYYKCEGTLQDPVAGPSGQRIPASIGRVAAPWGIKVVIWTAQRRGIHPDLPDPTEGNDGNAILYETWINPTCPIILQDGNNLDFLISGQYRYHLLLPVEMTDGYQSGKPPYLSLSDNDSIYVSKDFKEGILK